MLQLELAGVRQTQNVDVHQFHRDATPQASCPRMRSCVAPEFTTSSDAFRAVGAAAVAETVAVGGSGDGTAAAAPVGCGVGPCVVPHKALVFARDAQSWYVEDEVQV